MKRVFDYLGETSPHQTRIPKEKFLVDATGIQGEVAGNDLLSTHIRCGFVVKLPWEVRKIVSIGDLVFFHKDSGVQIPFSHRDFILLSVETDILAIKKKEQL